ncbi:hypothetical protein HMPREF1870_01352 [Bacteroidales bacterium KA00344]|nr:hypothetical protein HMPREF1870_01352 [Bacteroidales bacterium KA00344]
MPMMTSSHLKLLSQLLAKKGVEIFVIIPTNLQYGRMGGREFTE